MNRQMWEWHVYGQKAKPFLTAIQPYVIVKHDVVELALAFVDVLDHGRQISDAAAKRRLTRRLILAEITRINQMFRTPAEP